MKIDTTTEVLTRTGGIALEGKIFKPKFLAKKLVIRYQKKFYK